ncbi:hypothetical protein MFRU_005g01080 [Monilinia fructicola]|nr:hypothetical protein MFRU_005g01080 [Monilinia fructicola]
MRGSSSKLSTAFIPFINLKRKAMPRKHVQVSLLSTGGSSIYHEAKVARVQPLEPNEGFNIRLPFEDQQFKIPARWFD